MINLIYVLVIVSCYSVTARIYSDLEHVFTPNHVLLLDKDESNLRAAVKHEKKVIRKNQDKNDVSMHIACSSYSSVRTLESSLKRQLGPNDYHPVYFSRLNDKTCYTFNANSKVTTALTRDGVRTSIVPHALKIDSSVAWTAGINVLCE